MTKFKKKPIIIEAQQFTGGEIAALSIMRWANNGLAPIAQARATWDGFSLRIHTLEGEHFADPGDWIIRGIKGEFYPCKPDIFEATYDLVEDQP